MHCKNCGREIANQSKFCTFCGAELKEDNLTNPKEHHPYTSPSISQPTKQIESNTPQKKTGHKLPKQAVAILLVFLLGISVGGIVIYMTQSSKSSQSQQMKEGQSDTQTMADNTETNKTLAETTPKAEQTSAVITTEAASQTESPIDTAAPAETPVINGTPKAVEPAAPKEETIVTDTEVLEPPEWKSVVEGDALEKRVTHIREDVYNTINNKQNAGELNIEETDKLSGNTDKVTYYKDGSQIVKLVIKHGVSGREYYFEDGELCFGFLYTYPKGKEDDDSKQEDRIYFAKERVFRYIYGLPPKNGKDTRVIQDNEFLDPVAWLVENVVFNDIRQYMPEKQFIWQNENSVRKVKLNEDNEKGIALANITDTEIEYYDTFMLGDHTSIPYGKRKSMPISPEARLYYSKTGRPNDEYILCDKEEYHKIIASCIKWNVYGYHVWITVKNNMVVKCEEIIFP